MPHFTKTKRMKTKRVFAEKLVLILNQQVLFVYTVALCFKAPSSWLFFFEVESQTT